MIQVDLPASFAIGLTFSMLSRHYLKKETKLFTSRLLGPFNLYLSTGFATGGMFLLIGWPAWEIMYKAQWIENSYDHPWIAAFYIAFLIAMILLGNIGYVLGHYLYLKSKDIYVMIGLVLSLILTFLPFLLNWGIWSRIGTWEQVTQGEGYAFSSYPFFQGWLFIMSYMMIMGIGFGLLFIRLSKNLAQKL